MFYNLEFYFSQGPNLPLGNQSNPFVPASSDMPDTASSAMETDEDQIVSRSHLSDKQHQIKRNFEEKQRQEAKKRATEDKRNQKLVNYILKTFTKL